ncbi:carboxy terminal-processing peptidase [Flavobacterium sp. SM15]|uniref:carboxy terminal-processing peptidase n=1 Tax=Flavobacterium sp. SM15 TaxID=2908005 RepID=UPI001ED9F5B2|nr:carboxy terminal-processing peptidase [Flavobacterium sp. SM15]MCG2609965.1 carboxy terminal-processing peptidase [Flavobacterium sp. SM15]
MNTFWQFMKRNYKVVLLITVLSAILWSFVPHKKEDPEKDRLLLELLTFVLEKGHYDPITMDDAFSKSVYKEYLNAIDPSRRFFVQSDIDEFKKYETQIDDMVKNKDLTFFDLTYSRLLERMAESRKIYKEVLDKPFDFNKEESINTDYDKLPFSKNKAELHTRWEKQLKLSVLSSITDKMKLEEDKKKKDAAYKEKTFAEVEKDSRETTLKSLNEYFDFVGELDRNDWFSIYINSIVERYDPHTFYFAPEEKDKFDISMSGTLEGIGARLQKKNDITEISELIPGGPAWRGKELEQGDLILKVAQGKEEPVDVVGMRLDDVVKKIKGKKGTEVRLTVKKVDGTIKVISIIREVVELEETYAKSSVVKEGDKTFGIIYLPKFYIDFENKDKRDAYKDVAKEIERLKAQGVEGIVMDLRDNGGGSLQTVVDMVGLFIEDGPVVQVKSAGRKKDVLYDKDSRVQWDGPLVVMVNNFSASASEIFAAAIQDYKRGIVIGSKHTYGKGTVQNLIDLNQFVRSSSFGDLGALKTTTQKFYRINGGSTQREGVLSDIVMPDRYSYIEMGERDVENAMPWDKIDEASYKVSKTASFADVIAKSKERMAKSEQFKLIDENAKWINERKDLSVFSLNYKKFKADETAVETNAKKFKAIVDYKNDLKFTSLPYEQETFKNDTILAQKRERWHESLAKDVYVEEALNILSDMKSNTVVKGTINLKDKKHKIAEVK